MDPLIWTRNENEQGQIVNLTCDAPNGARYSIWPSYGGYRASYMITDKNGGRGGLPFGETGPVLCEDGETSLFQTVAQAKDTISHYVRGMMRDLPSQPRFDTLHIERYDSGGYQLTINPTVFDGAGLPVNQGTEKKWANDLNELVEWLIRLTGEVQAKLEERDSYESEAAHMVAAAQSGDGEVSPKVEEDEAIKAFIERRLAEEREEQRNFARKSVGIARSHMARLLSEQMAAVEKQTDSSFQTLTGQIDSLRRNYGERLDWLEGRVGDLENDAAGKASKIVEREEGSEYYANPFIRSRLLKVYLLPIQQKLEALEKGGFHAPEGDGEEEPVDPEPIPEWHKGLASIVAQQTEQLSVVRGDLENQNRRINIQGERMGEIREQQGFAAKKRMELAENMKALEIGLDALREDTAIRLRVLEQSYPSLEPRTTSNNADAKLARQIVDLQESFNRFTENTAEHIDLLCSRYDSLDSALGGYQQRMSKRIDSNQERLRGLTEGVSDLRRRTKESLDNLSAPHPDLSGLRAAHSEIAEQVSFLQKKFHELDELSTANSVNVSQLSDALDNEERRRKKEDESLEKGIGSLWAWTNSHHQDHITST